MNVLIKNLKLIDPSQDIDKVTDIFIKDGKISIIAENITEYADDIIDGSGMIAAPGLIDMHVHLREPGMEYKETIESGTLAAVNGGVTSVLCMPNTEPVADNAAIIEYIMNRKNRHCNVFPVGAITKGQKGKELADIAQMKDAGAIAVSDDGHPVTNDALMRNALEYAKNFDMLTIVHSECMSLSESGVMNEGAVATKLGLMGIPNVAECIAVARDVYLAEYTGAKIHIAHVSTKESVDIIRQAKKRGVNVTAETAPHYFSLTEAAVMGYNTNAKMNPPLRTQSDVDMVIAGLKDGTIDVIATDHAPHHFDDKNTTFDDAANGISGLETSLALGITYLVKPGHLTLSELICKMSVRPAEITRINKGTLSIGSDSDVVIFDENKEWTVDVNAFKSLGKNSPYQGCKLFGKVKYTIVGEKVYRL